MAKLGVVIFNSDYYSHEGLAALKWASDFVNSKLVRILLVQEEKGPHEHDPESLKGTEALYSFVSKVGKDNGVPDATHWASTFDACTAKFGKEADVSGIYYQGPNSIQEVLDGAIKTEEFDTLVLGMSALRSTRNAAGKIDLQLNSKCSVVLAKMDPNPMNLKTTLEVPDAPTDARVPPPRGATTSTASPAVPAVDPENAAVPAKQTRKLGGGGSSRTRGANK